MDKNSNIDKMKILHTADWHLGQSLYGFDRLDEQRRFLGQLCEVVAEERPDAMVLRYTATFGGRTTCLSSALCAVLQTIAPTIQRMSSPCLAKAI